MDGLTLLPPAPDKCQLCAVKHEPHEPHDATSLFYQMRFKVTHGRSGTWADAVAHCARSLADAWRRALTQGGHWTEPPAGVEPIAEPIESAVEIVIESRSPMVATMDHD